MRFKRVQNAINNMSQLKWIGTLKKPVLKARCRNTTNKINFPETLCTSLTDRSTMMIVMSVSAIALRHTFRYYAALSSNGNLRLACVLGGSPSKDSRNVRRKDKIRLVGYCTGQMIQTRTSISKWSAFEVSHSIKETVKLLFHAFFCSLCTFKH